MRGQKERRERDEVLVCVCGDRGMFWRDEDEDGDGQGKGRGRRESRIDCSIGFSRQRKRSLILIDLYYEQFLMFFPRLTLMEKLCKNYPNPHESKCNHIHIRSPTVAVQSQE